jgi:hypothetical protein
MMRGTTLRRLAIGALALLVGAGPIASATAADPTPSYALVKRAIASMSRTHVIQVDSLRDGDDDCGKAATCYDIQTCQFGSDFIGTKVTTATIYADVANVVGIWESDLPEVGYPERVWRPWTSGYEAAAIDTVKRYGAAAFYDKARSTLPSIDGLRRVLMRYRATHPKALPVINVGGCGAGEEPVKVTTEPAATQVSIIPTFFFELCRVQRIDPNDTTRCAHWREITGTVVQISGDYHYVARWHDGTVKRGVLGVNSEPTMMTGTITLRKP